MPHRCRSRATLTSHDDELTLSLDDPRAREAELVGEKAAALARMRQAGLPVPAGFVVHCHAQALALTPVAPALRDALTAPGDFETRGRSARAIVEAVMPPGPLQDALRAAYEALGAGPVAVRSSATLEDLPGASFAGQYDSFLDVTGHDELVARVVRVWASLHAPHAVAYRERLGLDHADARMAVLVQRLLPARAAGVLFTRDPVSGDATRMVVNAALGLGEGVVSGEIPSDVYVLHASTLEVTERRLADKTSMLSASETGLATVPVDDARRRTAALDDRELRELAALALRVRELEGGERDIEFAVHEGVQLLQARPVTGLDAAADEAFEVQWDDPGDRARCWRLWRDEDEPKPSRRLQEDLRREYMRHRRVLVEETGALPPFRDCLVRYFHGYPYVGQLDVETSALDARLAEQRAFAVALEAERRDYYEEVIEPEVQEALRRLGPFERPADESLASRFAHLREALSAYGRVMGDLHWRQLPPRMMPEGRPLPELYAELTGEPPAAAAVLLQGLDHRTAQLVRRLRELARRVQGDAELSALFAARDFQRVRRESPNDGEALRGLRRALDGLLADFGRRTGISYGSAAGFETPTWNLDPERPLALVASYAEQDLDALDLHEREAVAQREERTRTLREGLSPEQRAQFDHSLWLAHQGQLQMENHNALMEQGIAGLWREAVWWMGEALRRRDYLDAPDDVMHLSMAELEAIAGGDERDLRPLIAERVAERAERERMRPPPFVGDGPRPAPAAGAAPGEQRRPDAGLVDGTLRGTPASRGRATGRARVLQRGVEPRDIERGDILVASNVGQDLTPIFPLLGGLVLDLGAIFQHAALVAREYHVPAVLQTVEATRVIADGQRITVDGDTGTVELFAAE